MPTTDAIPLEPAAQLQHLAYAHGGSIATGVIKQRPEDFRVIEDLGFTPDADAQGEHDWLLLRKTRLNTEQLAKMLARHAGVAARAVSWSGMKDYHAVTEQWFSVWRPGRNDIDWSALAVDGVELLQHCQQERKIRRGTHKFNHFDLTIRRLGGDVDQLEQRLQTIAEQGVPNYFTAQRFGRNAANLTRARNWFSTPDKGKQKGSRHRDQHASSLMLSATRAFLFNLQLDDRLRSGDWNHLHHGEPANLQSTGSYFNADDAPDQQQRLNRLDIHPTCAMWGRFSDKTVAAYPELHARERGLVQRYPIFSEGLVQKGLSYARRATRIRIEGLRWQFGNDCLRIEFRLPKGQYATAVLRELISEPVDPVTAEQT